jgi:hypothetical protein
VKKTRTRPFRFTEPRYTRNSEVDIQKRLEGYFEESVGTTFEKLHNFPKYVPTRELRKMLYRHEIYKQILHVHGSIVEAGVLYGGGLMTWAHFSEIYEPTHHLRKIIGFDTFEGFPSVSQKDNTRLSDHARKGGYAVDTYEDLQRGIGIFHESCFLSHIPKIELVRGNVAKSLPAYLKSHPHLVVSLLHLDMDLYEPTKIMLRHLLPRIPKGGIIAFDELNQDAWQGETIAVMEEIGLPNLRLKRCSFGTTLSYAVIE